jgi:hypothetical protein
MHTFRPRHLLAVAMLGVALGVAACTTPPGPAPTTTTTTTTDVPSAPIISSFAVRGSVGAAPALVALTWTVSDPNGDPLTCRIDGDGDGDDDVVVPGCNGAGLRNVELAVAGSSTARLRVQDATFPAVEATLALEVATGPTESFDITLRGVDGLSTAQAAAFTQAEARWETSIVRGIQDAAIGPRPPCLDASSPDLPAVIDDVIIDVAVAPIDGAGNVLGRAGPTCFSVGPDLPLVGIMEFDSADVAALLADGSFDDVILHEMGHVLGIGTLWDTVQYGGNRKVISGAGTSDPRFTGGRGAAEYAALGATGNVPVESLGGPGTQDAHWRESVFGTELMTGFLNPGNNLMSALTIASLADLGYQVDRSTSDAYSLPGGAAARSAAPSEPGEVLRPVPAPA